MRQLIGVAALLLIACEQERGNGVGGAQPDNDQPRATAPDSAQPLSAAGSANTEATQEPARKATGVLPPPDAPLRFVGRWAAKADYCADKAWRFTATSLGTPAGSQCRFLHVQKVPGGYDIDARCTAEGPETSDRITLRFAESARAMLFESKTIADAGLVYCGK